MVLASFALFCFVFRRQLMHVEVYFTYLPGIANICLCSCRFSAKYQAVPLNNYTTVHLAGRYCK